MEKNKSLNVIYPGTFDPITLGHMDIIKRAMGLFGKLTVAITNNPNKKTLFTISQRKKMIQDCFKRNKKIKITTFNGLLVNFAKKQNAKIIIRGLREMSDFPTEFQTAVVNRKLCPEIETIFIMTDKRYFYVSSSLVKQLARLNAPIENFVPPNVEEELKKNTRLK
jgi:pantetheine-phosphate adenylyltransferase